MIELVLLLGLVLLVVGLMVAASNSAVDDSRSSMEEHFPVDFRSMLLA